MAKSRKTGLDVIPTRPIAYTTADIRLFNETISEAGYDVIRLLDLQNLKVDHPANFPRTLGLTELSREDWTRNHLFITFITCVDHEDYIQLLQNGYSCNTLAEDSSGCLVVVSASLSQYKANTEPESFYKDIDPVLQSLSCSQKNS